MGTTYSRSDNYFKKAKKVSQRTVDKARFDLESECVNIVDDDDTSTQKFVGNNRTNANGTNVTKDLVSDDRAKANVSSIDTADGTSLESLEDHSVGHNVPVLTRTSHLSTAGKRVAKQRKHGVAGHVGNGNGNEQKSGGMAPKPPVVGNWTGESFSSKAKRRAANLFEPKKSRTSKGPRDSLFSSTSASASGSGLAENDGNPRKDDIIISQSSPRTRRGKDAVLIIDGYDDEACVGNNASPFRHAYDSVPITKNSDRSNADSSASHPQPARIGIIVSKAETFYEPQGHERNPSPVNETKPCKVDLISASTCGKQESGAGLSSRHTMVTGPSNFSFQTDGLPNVESSLTTVDHFNSNTVHPCTAKVSSNGSSLFRSTRDISPSDSLSNYLNKSTGKCKTEVRKDINSIKMLRSNMCESPDSVVENLKRVGVLPRVSDVSVSRQQKTQQLLAELERDGMMLRVAPTETGDPCNGASSVSSGHRAADRIDVGRRPARLLPMAMGARGGATPPRLTSTDSNIGRRQQLDQQFREIYNDI